MFLLICLAQLQQVFSLLDHWERYHPVETKVWNKKQFITDYIAPIAQKSVHTDTKRADNIYRMATILTQHPNLKQVSRIFKF